MNPRQVKCAACGKMVGISKSGHILSHMNGASKCVFTGQSFKTSESYNRTLDSIQSNGRDLADKYGKRSGR